MDKEKLKWKGKNGTTCEGQELSDLQQMARALDKYNRESKIRAYVGFALATILIILGLLVLRTEVITNAMKAMVCGG